ncbi:MAG TPA: Asp-tRNA(Asn)/Glu-tRNA(Gln) amidotransferase subunit GatB [Planctomycetota bacterium]|nr:Asp-tRNA(Asn)/Glu-tRNA(Gln) amidotransferase subunit GatB [Planctomycetota bacterium]
MTTFTTVIGLEVHVQLATQSKLFSPAPAAALGDPNTRVHVIDLGLPGVLPRPNAAAIALAVRTALALGGDVRRVSRFARKNYFYPDLPKGYQISQYEEPVCLGGSVPLDDERSCRLHRIHIEEDAGKLTHGDLGTLVDLNRAGVPLVEIVSEPDLRNPADAHAFLGNLREILRFAGVSDCDMELGSMRCDANISLMPAGATEFGTKVEIKNLNSLKMVQRALEYEERRQAAVLSAGGRIAAETRSWNDETGESRPMRSKESAPDYRYFPDPDLPPLVLDEAFVETQRRALGELPQARRRRYRRTYGLPEYDIGVLTQETGTGDWFEAVVRAGIDAKTASNWVMSDVLPAQRERATALADFPVSPARLAELLRMLDEKALTQVSARQVFRHMLEHDGTAADAMRQLGLLRIADRDVLGPLVAAAIDALPEAAAAVRAGKDRAIDALKGNVMRATKGRADPGLVDEMLRAAIGPPSDIA